MSQQINLLLPELRPRFDWLSLPVVTVAALVGLLMVVILASISAWRLEGLKARETQLRGELVTLQQQVQSFGERLGARKSDGQLDRQLDAARTAIAQRQQVLDIVARGDLPSNQAYSGLFQGFARQAIDGAWLTGFGFAEKSIEIRGRLTDPALLSVYISRLNAEPAFAGRRFSELDMKGIDPAEKPHEAAAGVAPAATPLPAKAALPRYTEFVLKTTQEKAP